MLVNYLPYRRLKGLGLVSRHRIRLVDTLWDQPVMAQSCPERNIGIAINPIGHIERQLFRYGLMRPAVKPFEYSLSPASRSNVGDGSQETPFSVRLLLPIVLHHYKGFILAF